MDRKIVRLRIWAGGGANRRAEATVAAKWSFYHAREAFSASIHGSWRMIQTQGWLVMNDARFWQVHYVCVYIHVCKSVRVHANSDAGSRQ